MADDADDVDYGMNKTEDNSKNLGCGRQHRFDLRRHCWVLSCCLNLQTSSDLNIFCGQSEGVRLLKCSTNYTVVIPMFLLPTIPLNLLIVVRPQCRCQGAGE